MFTTTRANLAAQRQAGLFEPAAPEDFELTAPTAPAPKTKRDGWIGHPGPLGRNGSWTNPTLPGVTVRHCGHPTANWPYYVEGAPVLQGKTFRDLATAKEMAIRAVRDGFPK